MSQIVRKIRRKRFGDDHESHRAQLIWSFCVAVAVVVSALYEFTSPRPYLSRRLSSQERPLTFDRERRAAALQPDESERAPAARHE
jgi:hypothetical protein